MESSGFPVFRHAAGLLDGIMLVVGGNAHNESMPTRQTQCYATRIMAYDIGKPKTQGQGAPIRGLGGRSGLPQDRF